MNDRLHLLPEFIQQKIQSYLYFSGPVAQDMNVINNIIKNYESYLLKNLLRVYVFRKNTLYFRIVNYLYQNMTHVRVQQIMNGYIEYPMDENVTPFVIHAMSQMTLMENQKLYIYLTRARRASFSLS